MQLTAPIFILKQQAKALSRSERIPLHRALDRIARREGFKSWSLLAAKVVAERPSAALLARLRPGELVLLAARPRQGKTLLGLELALETLRRGRRAAFFTLEFTHADVASCVKTMGAHLGKFAGGLLVDDSDDISADHVVARLADAPRRTLVVVDYLQLLDQRRPNASLDEQVRRLKAFARDRQAIVLCLSQVDRRYDASKRPFPGLEDVRLPNPLDLGLFDQACFLSRGQLQVSAGAA